MKTVLIFIVVSLLLLLPGCSDKAVEKKQKDSKTMAIKPPKAERIKKEITTHEHTRLDYYYWLQERENPKVKEYINAENDYLKAVMKHTEGLQENLYNEMVGRLKKSDASVPYKLDDYYYYHRFEPGNEYPIYCRKKGNLEAAEEILLNVNEMAKGHDYYHVAGVSPSPDHKMIVFGIDTVSRRKYTIRFKNLETGELLEDQILNTSGSATWANDNKTVFYTVKDKTLRPYQVLKHRLGEAVEKDKEVFAENDVTYRVDIFRSKSKKYVFIFSASTLSTECRYLDADRPDGEFKIFHPREKDLLYNLNHLNGKFYIRTNWNAKNFRLMETSAEKTAKENWKEMIPHRKDVMLDNFEIFKNYLALKERQDGIAKLRIIKLADMSHHYLDFGEEVYATYMVANIEGDTDILRYYYSSLTTPRSIFDYDMVKRTKKLMKRDEVLGDFDPANYKAERHMAVVRDGVRVPISLVYRKGLEKNGENPLLLRGYGSYGFSNEASFRVSFLSLLDRGFVVAIAHIRGGQEMGRQWYEDGKLLKKKNTFRDFIDCGEYLIKEKFTNSKKLFAQGGSAGGLLMGAVTNMRPDLFKGIIANVAWMDVVTCMLDDSIPLTTQEYDEWGNPNNKEYYDYMLSYSPYDNLEAKDYPAILLTTGFHDSQVQYFDPAKYCAKMRHLKTDNNLLLLNINMAAGHGGSSGRFRRFRETALAYAFMFDLLGMKE